MRRTVVVGLLLFCAACAAGGRQQISTAPPPDPKTLMPALENRIYELVQQERQKIDPKAKALSLDSELVGVAREKSADMASRNYLGDKSPEGRTAAAIIMDKDASFQGLLGENIAAQHYLKDYSLDIEGYAHRFVETWLASKGHLENLAYPVYDRTGVGAAVNGDMVYVTELFATELGLPAETPAKREVTEFGDPSQANPASEAGGKAASPRAQPRMP